MTSRGILIGALIGAGWLAASPTLAEDLPTTIIRPGEDRLQITRLPTPGGEVILPTDKDRLQNHDQYLYAAARRAGDFVYLAGVIVGRLPGEGNDTDAFKAQLRRAFATIERNLKASGASMADVVDMQTLAVFGGPDFTGEALNLTAKWMNEFYDGQWKEKVPEDHLRATVVKSLVQEELKQNRFSTEYQPKTPTNFDSGAVTLSPALAAYWSQSDKGEEIAHRERDEKRP